MILRERTQICPKGSKAEAGGTGCSRVTFLPPPDGDRVLGIHSHRHQQFARRAEVDVVDPFGVEAAQH